MRKLRLFMFKDCNRNCVGCCNKDWDIDSLRFVNDWEYSNYDEILLTGGEPLLKPRLIYKTVRKIKKVSPAKIFLYTAKPEMVYEIPRLLEEIDGITLTLHETIDAWFFRELNYYLHIAVTDIKNKSMRLNIFKGVEVSGIPDFWKVKSDMVWVRNCPLPEDEEMMRLPNV